MSSAIEHPLILNGGGGPEGPGLEETTSTSGGLIKDEEDIVCNLAAPLFILKEFFFVCFQPSVAAASARQNLNERVTQLPHFYIYMAPPTALQLQALSH